MLPRDEPHVALAATLTERSRTHHQVIHLSTSTSVAITALLVGVVLLILHTRVLSKIRPKLCEHDSYSLSSVLRVLAVCGVYMVVGPSLMVVNKEILQTLGFGFPLTVAGLGLFGTSIVIRAAVACGICEVSDEAREAVEGRLWHWTVLPIAAAKAATLACGNVVYLHLGLGFIQMLKAFNPVIVVVVMSACGLPVPSRLARWGVYLIISGTLLEVRGELHATLLGIFFMMSSEVMEAINLVLTQKLLQLRKFTLTEGLYMISPPSCFLLFVTASLLEWPRIAREAGYRIMMDHPWHFVASSALGLLVNFVGMAVVQATSSLTMKVLNTARGVAVVLVGVLFYGEYCSPLELFGYGCALAGFSLYNYAQLKAS